MQATTVQLLCAGLAIRHHANPSRIANDVEEMIMLTKTMNYGKLAPFTAAEAKLYKAQQYFLYETDYFSVTVMTDTTERAPTFSMPPFENFNDPTQPPSPVYLLLPSAPPGPLEGWTRLLRRPPRTLEWAETKHRTGLETVLGYDISPLVAEKRAQRIGHEKTKHRAVVALETNGVSFAFPHEKLVVVIELPSSIVNDKLLVNVAAKMLLNAHSTAVMGVLGRYEGNVMTFARPSNFKLIDRAARYITLLLQRRLSSSGAQSTGFPSYEAICRAIYARRGLLREDEPIVLDVVGFFSREMGIKD
jgi:N-acetylmuramic acid 6-phosphate etherase